MELVLYKRKLLV